MKRFDPQAKAKKQKRILIVGAVLLVALLAFQVPRTLKQSNQKAPEVAQAPAPTAPAGPGTSPGGPEALASAAPEGSAKLPSNPDPAPVAMEGQLVSFSRFESKDPFAQQLAATSSNGETGTEAPPATPPPSSPPVSSPPASTPPASTPPASTPPASTPPASAPPSPAPSPSPPATPPPPSEPPADPAPSSATISVNGVSETVQLGGAFPKANPLFRLVAIKDGVAKIGIAGGSLKDGAQTASLQAGKPLTLMNTADGTRYVLRLVSLS